MTIPEMKAVIIRALDTDGILHVENYTNSAGFTRSYTLNLLPDNTYIETVAASLKKLSTPEFKQAMLAQSMLSLKDGEIALADREDAIRLMIDSFNKSINNQHAKPSASPDTSLTELDGIFYYDHELKTQRIETLILRHFEVLNIVRHAAGDKGLPPKGKIPAAKYYIKKSLPIDKFGGQLNLTMQSVRHIRANI